MINFNRKYFLTAIRIYATFVISFFVVLFFLRVLEYIGLSNLLPYTGLPFLKEETLAFLYDIARMSLYLILLIPFFLIFSYYFSRFTKFCSIVLLLVYTVFSIPILYYFMDQLNPLDASFWTYSFKEMGFTVLNSGYNLYLASLVISFGAFLVIFTWFILEKLFKKDYFKAKLNKFIYIGLILILIVSSFCKVYFKKSDRIILPSNYFINKTVLFIAGTLKYVKVLIENRNLVYNATEAAYLTNKMFATVPCDSLYPLEREFEIEKYRLKQLTKSDTLPNIYIIIVEGLAEDYINDYNGVEPMPFLTDLKEKSLYWPNCFSLGERSYAAVPMLLGGLPHGKKGFTLEPSYPNHQSLIKVANDNGYVTNFFYGQGSWFHQKDRFFRAQEVDNIFDNLTFPDHYTKIMFDDFFVGYEDKDLFNNIIEQKKSLKNPMLNVVFTGTMHSPFDFSDSDKYTQLSDSIWYNTEGADTTFYGKYKKYLSILRYTDDAIRDFIDSISKIDTVHKPLFIITGDHPMSEIHSRNRLKMYNVPLIIYNGKDVHKFNYVVSHADVYNTIMAYFSDLGLDIPLTTSSIGEGLGDVNSSHFYLMCTERFVNELYIEPYFLSKGSLYYVHDNLVLEQIENDSIKNDMLNNLRIYNNIDRYVCIKNKLLKTNFFDK